VKYFPAPAKLNLFLHVVGRRADGYHLLQSVFRLIEHGDELGIELRDDGAIRRLNAVDGVPADSDLCLRAANLLQQHTRCTLGADIELVKKLPLGAGLGGGSSDAATALLALNLLWNTRLSRRALQELGAQLGADVPFFLYGESAFVEGIGERLTPVALQPAWYLVLVPAVQVPTAEIFGAAELRRDAASILPAQYGDGFGANVLEPVTRARYPEVARHLDWLSQHAAARMTGSGACVFAEFPAADAARTVLESLPSGMRGFVARGLDRHPLHDLVSGDSGMAA
jgi:4-diphosphocytidyl-2-C-methyl-D-erythritol kinase